MTDIKRVICFRHGETDWNKDDLIQGLTDKPLNETGRQQVLSLREMLLNEGIQHIFSSDLSRAVQTASIISEGKPITVSTHPEIREVNFGIAEGKLRSQMRIEYPQLYELLAAPENPLSHLVSFPSGETRMDVFNRVSSKLYKLLLENNSDIVGVSTHGGVIGAILGVAFQKWVFVEPCQAIEFSFCKESGCFTSYLGLGKYNI